MDYELQAAHLTHCTQVFIDDILIHSNTFEEHLEHIEQVLKVLHRCGLKAHPEKSLFCTSTIEFLGFDVSQYGMTPQEAKIKALLEMPHPRNLEQLRSTLGQQRYYGCFCPNFSAPVRPMLDLLKKDKPWQWRMNGPGSEGESFEAVRKEIATPGKALQCFRPDRPIFVHCDFSTVGLGAVLAQVDDNGNEVMVACCSRSLNKQEGNYSATRERHLQPYGLSDFSNTTSMAATSHSCQIIILPFSGS
jgi:hypothetical protein